MQVQVLVNAGLSIPTSPEACSQQGTQPHEDALPWQQFSSGGLFWAQFPRDTPGVSLDQTGQRFPRHKPCRCHWQGQALILPAEVEGEGTSAGLAQLLGTGRMQPAGDPWQRGPFQEGEGGGCQQREAFVNASPTMSLPG